MTFYVIKHPQFEFVAERGFDLSYTANVKYAMKFQTREDAEIEACDNEFICLLEEIYDH